MNNEHDQQDKNANQLVILDTYLKEHSITESYFANNISVQIRRVHNYPHAEFDEEFQYEGNL